MATVTGTPFDDQDGRLTGTPQNDVLQGLAGRDFLFGSAGNDVLNGGPDDDVAFYENLGASVFINNTASFQEGVAPFTVAKTGVGTDQLISIEAMHGSNLSDVIYAVDYYVFDRGGDDRVIAVDMEVNFIAGSGSDVFFGLGGGELSYDSDDFDAIPSFRGVQSLGYDANGVGQVIDRWGDIDTFSGVSRIRGSALADSLIAGGAVTRLDGAAGDDTLSAGAVENVRLEGGVGADSLLGGDGDDDRLRGGRGNDTLNGGGGDRDEARYDDDLSDDGVAISQGIIVTFTGDGAATVVDGWGDTDTLIDIERVRGTDLGDTMAGGDGDERLRGEDGDDVIDGGLGDNRLEGGAGDDVITSRGRGDSVEGEDGDDLIRVLGPDTTVAPGLGDDTIEGSFEPFSTILSYEDLDIAVTVDLQAGVATAAGMTDRFFNVYRARGGADADVLLGGWNDEYESYDETPGGDFIDGRTGFDELIYNIGDTGDAGIVMNFAAGTVRDTHGDLDTFRNIDAVRATNEADSITGSDQEYERYRALGGADTIIGGGGVDEIDHRRDFAYGGGGAVTVDLAAGFAIDGFGDRDVISGVNWVRGTQQGDSLSGDAGANRLRGEGGDDMLRGAGGADDIRGGDGFDTAVYDLTAASYGLASFGDVTAVVGLAGDRATDRTTGVERFQFADRAFDAPAARFDAMAYVASHADLSAVFGADAQAGFDHYVDFGWREGRSVTFDAVRYLASHTDLLMTFGADAAAGAAHYVASGRDEGRGITFDGLTYIASHADLIDAFGANAGAGVAHYVSSGFAEGRRVTFDGLEYIASHADLRAAFGTDAGVGVLHYITAGAGEGRTVTFDGLEYIASHADLRAAFGTDAGAGAAHYIAAGAAEGRTITFSGLEYIASHTDLTAAFGLNADAGAAHYIAHGADEGRGVTFDAFAFIAGNNDRVRALGVDREAAAALYISSGFTDLPDQFFDAAQYLENYADLRAAFGDDLEAATLHYIRFGIDENRTDDMFFL